MSLFNRTSTIKSTKDQAFELFFRESVDTDVNIDKFATENDEKHDENYWISQRNTIVSRVSCEFYEIIHSHLSDLGKNIISLESSLKVIFGVVDSEEIEGKINSSSQIEECIQDIKKRNNDNILKLDHNKNLLNLLKKKIDNEKEFYKKIFYEKDIQIESFNHYEFTEIVNTKYLIYESYLKLLSLIFIYKYPSENGSFSCSESVCSKSLQTKLEEKIKKLDLNFFKEILLKVNFNFEDLKEIRENISITRQYLDRYNQNSVGKFFKLINLLVFLSIAMKKIDTSKEYKKKIKKEIQMLLDRINENDWKIVILQGILRKLLKNNIDSQDTREACQNLSENEIKTIINQLKNLKNTFQINYNSYLRQIGKLLIKPSEL